MFTGGARRERLNVNATAVPVLAAEALRRTYPDRRGGGRLPAVDGVSLQIGRREIVGLVGESGCGKSTLGRLVLALEAPDSGSVRFAGEEISGLSHRRLRPWRRWGQMIFQDPYSSLNPRMRIRSIIEEPLVIHRRGDRDERHRRVAELLEVVGLDADMGARYPHEFSGGQRQRIGIARALALAPEFIVADEPVSALDVSIQAQILNLLQDLRERFDFSMLFISHDLSVIRMVSDRVLVMYLGKLVEEAPAASLFAAPRHPYTRLLLDSIPVPDPRRRRRPERGKRAAETTVAGDVAVTPRGGCRFAARCPRVLPICQAREPALEAVAANHFVACWQRNETLFR
jgi:oligopeptide/dipeptide ABC transporter ATP-binding protein